ncbi:hypothetical protein H6758_00850 [Candidatus Nomurabacteria bacterium]|nr:hypothetical protein [Candidatus Nomurabacteria bacterium]
MSAYLAWEKKILENFDDASIDTHYDAGFVFTRRGKGEMDQTRSIRIDLAHFELSSENKRILRKTEEIKMKLSSLPLSDYHWSIGKMAKDFYDTKFGQGTFSANKVKELFTHESYGNFNRVFVYSIDDKTIGYCIALETENIIHYSYPFYALDERINPNTGMGMMVRAIVYAQEQGKKYLYLGSAQRPGDTYKMQFKGLEWFDGRGWSKDLEGLKHVLKEV